MTFLLILIALPGIAAVVLRWSRAQHGDISGMSEAESLPRAGKTVART